MKSWVLILSILAVSIFAFDNPSWAMGRKGKGERSRFGGSSGSSTQASSSEGGYEQSTFSLEPLVKEDKPSETPKTVTPPSGETTNQPVTQTAVEEDFPSSATVPEPATLTLMGLGMAGLLYSRRKK